MRLAIIPARGGSKRIPRKNIKDFLGKPIISYAIQAALESNCFDDVLVSTDDAEIAEVALRHGASVPFMRSPKTSDDITGTVPVLLEVLAKKTEQYNDICCIYPCSPLIQPGKINEALEKHLKLGAESTFTVVKYGHPPQRGLTISSGWAKMKEPGNYSARTQDLKPVYHDAGQFYWLNVEALKLKQRLIMDRSYAVILSELECQDIDTVEDWILAEVKYELWRKNKEHSLLELEQKAQEAL